MGILELGLQKATILMIKEAAKLKKIELSHIITQKLGNNPIDVFVDNNIYYECKLKDSEKFLIAGFGESNDQGLSGTREIDYASYVTKMAVALKEVPLIRTNGPFSNVTLELQKFLHIWKKYYGSRTSQRMLNIKDMPVNPFTVISSSITIDERTLHFDMVIANTKLLETNPGELKYYGDLLLFISENLGYGSNYTDLGNYSAKSEDRTTLSAFDGNPYGKKLVEAVEHSFERLSFIQIELEKIDPKLTAVNRLLWVSNHFNYKKNKELKAIQQKYNT